MRYFRSSRPALSFWQRGRRPEAVAQDVEVAVLRRPEFHAPEDADAQSLPGLDGLAEAVHRVVVRQGQHLDAPGLSQLYQLRGRVLSVRGSGMGVQICGHIS